MVWWTIDPSTGYLPIFGPIPATARVVFSPCWLASSCSSSVVFRENSTTIEAQRWGGDLSRVATLTFNLRQKGGGLPKPWATPRAEWAADGKTDWQIGETSGSIACYPAALWGSEVAANKRPLDSGELRKKCTLLLLAPKWQGNSLSGALRTNNIWAAMATEQVGCPADRYASLNGMRNAK